MLKNLLNQLVDGRLYRILWNGTVPVKWSADFQLFFDTQGSMTFGVEECIASGIYDCETQSFLCQYFLAKN